VDCQNAREALSARLDGERPGIEPALLETHLAGCPSCRDWLEAAHRLTRRARLRPAPAVPDRTGDLVAAVLADRAASGRERNRPIRAGLIVIAALQLLAVAVADGGGLGRAHLSRELGSFGLALAVGFLAAAHRPSRAWGMLPVAGVAAACLLASAAAGIAEGRSQILEEAPHLLTAAGWLLLYLLSRTGTTRRSGPRGKAAEALHRFPRWERRLPDSAWRGSGPAAHASVPAWSAAQARRAAS
jgi:predicted anti-sigma-YlaC factor YlaD